MGSQVALPSSPVASIAGVWRLPAIGAHRIRCSVGLLRTAEALPKAGVQGQTRWLERLLAGEAAAAGCPRSRLAASRSYTDSYAICAVARSDAADPHRLRLGIDIEWDPGPARFPDDEIDSVCIQMGLAVEPRPKERRARFFRAWTELEARGKALGSGLMLPPVEISRQSHGDALIDLQPVWRDQGDRISDQLYGSLCLLTDVDPPDRQAM